MAKTPGTSPPADDCKRTGLRTPQRAATDRATLSPQDALFDLLAEALVELALSTCLEAEAEPVCPQRRA
jgi:hypothetical protein